MTEQLSPERAVRLLRAKAAELEHRVNVEWDEIDRPMTTIGLNMAVTGLAADIALVAQLLADHIERSERHDEQLRQMYERSITEEARQRMQRLVSEPGPEYEG